MTTGFVPPAYPYDRLGEIVTLASRFDGGPVDCSIGTPFDPPPALVIDALARSDSARGYPPSIGTPEFRRAAAGWMQARLGVTVDPDADLAACVGTKEFVVSTPHYLRLRRPARDTVLYPAVSYPSYAMGATLAGCRAVPVAVDDQWRIDLGSISPDDAERAVCLWVNTPGNPAGGLDDLGAVADWGREHGMPVLSDECYVEFTWDGPARTILASGLDGVVAVHSLSKRSNLAGGRVGFFAGDPDLVDYLREVRKHAGLMVPGPVQDAAVAAWRDQDHVEQQRDRHHERLEVGVAIFEALGIEAPRPAGGFYLWVRLPPATRGASPARLPSGPASCEPRRVLRCCGRRPRAGGGGAADVAAHPCARAVALRRAGPPAAAAKVPPMSDLSTRIEALWERRDTLDADDPEVVATIHEAIDRLDDGTARVAEIDAAGAVVVHAWCKYAVLLLFKVSKMATIENGPFEYADKIPLKHDFMARGVRWSRVRRPAGAATRPPAW
ncbi:MAG: aminotransferase class I/II-fold pyridoxal phosphate-dependent enzyme [Acidimicrobiales bacterium]